MLRAQSYRVGRTAIAAVLVFALAPRAWSQAVPTRPEVPYRTIAITGEPKPGEPGKAFRIFDYPPKASETGQVVFQGRDFGETGPSLYLSSAGNPATLGLSM